MNILEFDIAGPALLIPAKKNDSRGFFSEVFKEQIFRQQVADVVFVQDNHAHSQGVGVLRGLHFQRRPADQGKLVRVARGTALDVIVDVRAGSQTWGRHIAVELSEENWSQLWVPSGFLHGYCTLTDEVDFLYKVTAPYSPSHEGTVVYNDPDLAIDWPFTPADLIVSPRDAAAPRLRDIAEPFPWP